MKTKNNILFLALLVCLYSCDDIIEQDISDETVTVIYPKNGVQIESNVVNFQWNEVDGADDYRLQVYSTNQNIVVDTVVSSSHFTLGLLSGNYQWRVRGENFAYETAYSFPESFTLVETTDLTNQQVQLASPASGLYTKNQALTFSWLSVNAAQYYNFELINVTSGNSIVHQESEIEENSHTLDEGVITQDAQYQWKVKAVNPDNDTETVYSTRIFYVDTTAPNQPQNLTPEDNESLDVNQVISFDWSVPSDTGVITSPISFIFQLSEDESFENIVYSQSTTSSSLEHTITLEGDYYWRIRAVDQAGNESLYSNVFELNIE